MQTLTLTKPVKTIEKNRRNRSPQRDGFTLLEVTVVLFILVSIMAMAVVAVRARQISAQKQLTFNYVKMLENQVKLFAVDIGRPPTNEEGLAALVRCPPTVSEGKWVGYIEDTAISIDSWGNEYQYSSPGRNNKEFSVWSFGPDGMDGTDDDIGSWSSAPN